MATRNTYNRRGGNKNQVPTSISYNRNYSRYPAKPAPPKAQQQSNNNNNNIPAQPPTSGNGGGGVSSRIPSTLQAVFLASNRGNDVHKPPPDSAASKVYFRNWLFQGGKQKSKEKNIFHNPNRRSIFGRFHHPRDMKQQNQNQQQQNTTVTTAAATTASVRDDTVATELDESITPAATTPPTKVGTPSKSKKKKKPEVSLSPQQYLDSMIRHRGYSTIRYKTLDSGYYYRPSALQLASYDAYLIRIAKLQDNEEFHKLLQCGISPNPCNTFGESLLHTVCRCGDAELLQIMLESGTDVAVADDYGRTPLHDACWSAKRDIFDVIALLLQNDHGPSMFYMADCRGFVPLQYVSKDHWADWIQWLESHKELYWPRRNRVTDGEQAPPALTLLKPNSRAAPIPNTPLTPELAKMVVSGRMQPEEAEVLRYYHPSNNSNNPQDDTNPNEDSEEEDSDEDDSDDDSDDDDDDSDDDDSDYDSDDDDFDADEMADILQLAGQRRKQ